MQTNTEVQTRPQAGKEAVTTNLTIDWDGMTEDDLRALAQQSLIVKLQGQWRRDVIPTELTVKAIEHKVGVRGPRTKADLMTQVKSLSAEDKARLLALLSEG
jgi:hypothetical protein